MRISHRVQSRIVAKRPLVLLFGVALSASLALVGTSTADAATGTVSTVPASFTPWLLSSPVNQRTWELQQCGGTMYAVGQFTAIGQGSNRYTRSNAFSFSATTGAVTSWNPSVSGGGNFVHSVALSPDCSTAYLGGDFTTVNGIAASNIVAVDTVTGAVRTGFAHSATNEVDTVQYTHGQVLAGGLFGTINGVARSRFASLDPTTGAVTGYANLGISGAYPNTGTKIYNSQLSHSGDKMLVEGVFTSVAGLARQQIFMLDLGATAATVDPWTSAEFSQACNANLSFYVRGANWSPDDATVYIATTGYKPAAGPGSSTTDPRAGLCDAAAAFPATSAAVTHKWINYTGCDSYYAVAADANNVYVSGHERWANNPLGCDAAGPGAVSRPGIASLTPTTGQATAWNPTRSLGYGTAQLLITTAGLWVASDDYSDGLAQKCGGLTNHGGICFFPY
jgi:hypothetical protein